MSHILGSDIQIKFKIISSIHYVQNIKVFQMSLLNINISISTIKEVKIFIYVVQQTNKCNIYYHTLLFTSILQ